MYSATTDPAAMLSALAFERRRPTIGLTEAISRKLQFVMDLIGVRSAFLSALSSTEMQVLAVEDRAGCAISPGLVPLEESFCQYVKATEESVVIPDAAQDVRVAHVATRRDFHIGAYLGVPIRLSDQQLVGTLCVVDPAPVAFSPHHVALVEIVAGDIAALLDRQHSTTQHAQALSDADSDVLAAFAALDSQQQALQTVAHDLRTPLMGITFSLDALLHDHFGPLLPEQRDMLGVAFSAGKYMQRLIIDLSDAIAAEAGTLSLLSAPFDALALVRRLIVLSTPEVQAAGLEVDLDCDREEVPMIGDEVRLSQILLNLLTNALRYSDHGRVTVRIRLQDATVSIAVIDNGPGIAPADQQRIWDAYERVAHDQPGVGLGLSIVATLTRAMGGTVELQSTLGHGSTFVIHLPQQILSPKILTSTHASA